MPTQVTTAAGYDLGFVETDAIVFDDDDIEAVAVNQQYPHDLGLAMFANIGQTLLYDSQHVEFDFGGNILIRPSVLEVNRNPDFILAAADQDLCGHMRLYRPED